jgi:hypothetical protein
MLLFGQRRLLGGNALGVYLFLQLYTRTVRQWRFRAQFTDCFAIGHLPAFRYFDVSGLEAVIEDQGTPLPPKRIRQDRHAHQILCIIHLVTSCLILYLSTCPVEHFSVCCTFLVIYQGY